jgi:hypothetical protein
MKKMLLIAGSLLVLTGMSACADYGYGYGHGPGRYADYDLYYDDYYGPVREGYWGDDGLFYYRDAHRRWQRDDGRHFRRDSYNGYRQYRIHHGHR